MSRETGSDLPDTSDLSDQEAKQIRFWNRRLQGSATSKDREHALKEIRKIDPEFTPSDTPKTLKESVDKFFTDEVRIGPNGERIVTKKLIEMG